MNFPFIFQILNYYRERSGGARCVCQGRCLLAVSVYVIASSSNYMSRNIRWLGTMSPSLLAGLVWVWSVAEGGLSFVRAQKVYPDTVPSYIYLRGYVRVLCDIVRIVGFLVFLVDCLVLQGMVVVLWYLAVVVGNLGMLLGTMVYMLVWCIL